MNVGALALAVRMFRSVRRHGIFDGRVATRLRNIGSLILFGGLLASVGEAMATYALADTMLVEPIGTWTWFNDWDVPLLAAFFGAALISFARVMRISIDMRTELDETV